MNIASLITQSNLAFDRNLYSTLVLPYSSFEEIRIQPNDIVSNALINFQLKKLYDNFLYLYKSTQVASTVIPVSSIALGGVSATNAGNILTWVPYVSSSSMIIPLSTIGIYGETSIQEIEGCKNKEKDVYSIFTSTGKDIVAYNSNSNNSVLYTVLSTNELSPNSNIRWRGIVDMTFSDSNNFYVVDLSANRLAKYDASGFLTNDNVIENLLIYKDTIGGYGDYNANTQFNRPQGATVYEKELYVLDSGNGCIKKFDEELNWLHTYRLFRDFLSAYPIDIDHDAQGNIYLLCENGFILKYDKDFSTKQVYDIQNLKGTNIEFKKIIFSQADTNICYIITNQNVYKKLVSSFDKIVGPYLLYLQKISTPENILGFTAIPKGAGSDFTILASNYQNRTIFQLYEDNINLYDVLSINNFDIYSFNEIAINMDEYVQNWVFNKTISKLLLNHMRLRDQIIGKFLQKRNTRGDYIFVGTRYLLPEELNSIFFDQTLDFYIGANEVFQNSTINKVFKKFFDIQTAILNVLQTENVDLKDPALPVFI